MIKRLGLAALLLLFSFAARAQLDYSAYGTLDLSYGRFEASGFDHRHRFNSNSLSASFVGVQAKYGLDGGWTPGINLETFLRFQDLDYGRNDNDPFWSRNNFISLQHNDYGFLRIGRLQTYLFETSTRFNAFGNSTGFSPSLRQLFLSGNLEGVDGDFYWDRAISYSTPRIEGVQGNFMYSLGRGLRKGDYAGSSIVFSRGVFAASVAVQKVHINDGIEDETDELTLQAGATYNFGWGRLFGQYSHLRDKGHDVKSRIATAGVSVPVWQGDVLAQIAYSTTKGPAVDRRHTSTSLGYVYHYDTDTDFYLLGMDDRVRNQTRGISVAVGGRYQF